MVNKWQLCRILLQIINRYKVYILKNNRFGKGTHVVFLSLKREIRKVSKIWPNWKDFHWEFRTALCSRFLTSSFHSTCDRYFLVFIMEHHGTVLLVFVESWPFSTSILLSRCSNNRQLPALFIFYLLYKCLFLIYFLWGKCPATTEHGKSRCSKSHFPSKFWKRFHCDYTLCLNM